MLQEGRATHSLVRALISKSNIISYQTDHAGANVLLHQASDLLTSAHEPLLHFAVHANRAANLAWLAQFDDAMKALAEARAACAEIENSQLVRSQLTWIEGFAQHGRGHSARGRQLLIEARREFIDLGETEHASVVSLDLAIRWLEAKEYARARDLLLETLPIFQALEHHDELCVSLGVLAESCKAEALELASLRELRTQIEKLRLDPARRFQHKD